MDILAEFKKLKKDKRGMGIGDIYPIMLTICLVAILIAVILFVLTSFKGQIADTSFTVTNETGAWLNNTGYFLDSSTVCGFNTPVITGLWNYTADVGTLIPAANYSISELGLLTNGTNLEYASVNLSYTLKGGATSCEAIEEVQVAIADFVPWIGIILLIVAAAIVLGILIRNLAGGSSRV